MSGKEDRALPATPDRATHEPSQQAVSAVPVGIPSAWQPIETAPKDRPVLVWYDHDADPYQDPDNPGRLTDYACHAEGGSFLSGQGMAIAHWNEGWHEDDGWESFNPPYWMPAVWLAWLDGDNLDQAVNPLFWISLPEPPAQAIEARRAETGEDAGSVHKSAVPEGNAP